MPGSGGASECPFHGQGLPEPLELEENMLVSLVGVAFAFSLLPFRQL